MELWAIIPELILAGLCLVLVPVAGWARKGWTLLPGGLAIAGLVAAMIFTARMLWWEPVGVFHGVYAIDGLATVSKLLIEAGALITIVLMLSYFRHHPHLAAAPAVTLFTALGAVCFVSSLDLALIVLFLQMVGLSSYVLAALVRSDGRALEASIKYLLFGGIALAVMAYGLTFLYGLTGSLDLRVIGRALLGADGVWVGVALSLILAGYGFEMTILPFHFWAPDVFSGATAPVSGFVSVVPKIAAFAGLARILLQGMPGLPWPMAVAILAAVTMTFGNLAALRQRELKRLLAYSSIAQAGYLLLALAVLGAAPGAASALTYYLAAYLFMNLGAFAAAAQMERTLGNLSIDALRGLARRSPAASAALALSLLSLAGIPPLAGFAGKVLLLKVAVDGGLTWLAVVAAANMAVGLFYYVSVIAEIYLRQPETHYRPVSGRGYRWAYALCLTGTFALGVMPGPNLEIASLADRLLW